MELFFQLQPDINIISLTIHYIDTFPFDYQKNDVFNYLKSNLRTSFSFDPELFIDTNISPIPNSFHFEVNFPVSEPIGHFICQLRSRMRRTDNVKLIVMDSIFNSKGNEIPKKNINSYSSWIKKADDLICEWFYRMIKNMKGLD